MRAIGLNDRGLLQAGYKADINVIDYERLAIGIRKSLMICQVADAV